MAHRTDVSAAGSRPATFDEVASLKRNSVDVLVSWKRVCRLTQNAQREISGYFDGYIAQRQPVSSYELDIAQRGLTILWKNMIGKNPQHQARMTIKSPADLEERGTMRTSPEDCYLATHIGYG